MKMTLGLKGKEAHWPQLAHQSEIATTDMHLSCNNFFLHSVIATNEMSIIQADLGFEEEECVFFTHSSSTNYYFLV